MVENSTLTGKAPSAPAQKIVADLKDLDAEPAQAGVKAIP